MAVTGAAPMSGTDSDTKLLTELWPADLELTRVLYLMMITMITMIMIMMMMMIT